MNLFKKSYAVSRAVRFAVLCATGGAVIAFGLLIVMAAIGLGVNRGDHMWFEAYRAVELVAMFAVGGGLLGGVVGYFTAKISRRALAWRIVGLLGIAVGIVLVGYGVVQFAAGVFDGGALAWCLFFGWVIIGASAEFFARARLSVTSQL